MHLDCAPEYRLSAWGIVLGVRVVVVSQGCAGTETTLRATAAAVSFPLWTVQATGMRGYVSHARETMAAQ